MGKKRAKLDNLDEAQEVVSRFKKEKELWKKERLQTIKLLLETENSYREVAEIVGRHPSRVKEWAKQFRSGGLGQLLTRGNGGGCKSKVPPEIEEKIVKELRKGSFRTARQLRDWLEKTHQIQYKERSIYYVLGKLGGRLKVPRPSHTKKDPEAVKAFREGLADKMLALNLPQGKPVKLWVYDEMRYGLHPLVRKMWSLVGHRVVAPVNRRYQWGYLFGAIEVADGESEFLFTDGVLKGFDQAFLNQLSRQTPECEHIVIGDGAGFHHREGKEERENLPPNVHILTLPPYSPELNPIEKLWDIVKDRICQKCWDDLAELESEITKVLREWWQREKGFSSLFRHSYLRSELNVI